MKRFNYNELLNKLIESFKKENFVAFDVSLWFMSFLIQEGKGFEVEYPNGRVEFVNSERQFKRLLNKLGKDAMKNPQVKQIMESI